MVLVDGGQQLSSRGGPHLLVILFHLFVGGQVAELHLYVIIFIYAKSFIIVIVLIIMKLLRSVSRFCSTASTTGLTRYKYFS